MFNNNLKLTIMETIQFLGEVEVSLGNINIDKILNEFPELKSYLGGFIRTENGAFISAVSFKLDHDGDIDFNTLNSSIENAIEDWKDICGNMFEHYSNGEPDPYLDEWSLMKEKYSKCFTKENPEGFKFRVKLLYQI